MMYDLGIGVFDRLNSILPYITMVTKLDGLELYSFLPPATQVIKEEEYMLNNV